MAHKITVQFSGSSAADAAVKAQFFRDFLSQNLSQPNETTVRLVPQDELAMDAGATVEVLLAVGGGMAAALMYDILRGAVRAMFETPRFSLLIKLNGGVLHLSSNDREVLHQFLEDFDFTQRDAESDEAFFERVKRRYENHKRTSTETD